jgi:hypothetical protein
MKKYMTPMVETVSCHFQNLMKVASDVPIDPGFQNNSLPAPKRRTEVF